MLVTHLQNRMPSTRCEALSRFAGLSEKRASESWLVCRTIHAPIWTWSRLESQLTTVLTASSDLWHKHMNSTQMKGGQTSFTCHSEGDRLEVRPRAEIGQAGLGTAVMALACPME